MAEDSGDEIVTWSGPLSVLDTLLDNARLGAVVRKHRHEVMDALFEYDADNAHIITEITEAASTPSRQAK